MPRVIFFRLPLIAKRWAGDEVPRALILFYLIAFRYSRTCSLYRETRQVIHKANQGIDFFIMGTFCWILLSIKIKWNVELKWVNAVRWLCKCSGVSLKPIKYQCSPSYRNQSNDLQRESSDWFLYDAEHWSVKRIFSFEQKKNVLKKAKYLVFCVSDVSSNFEIRDVITNLFFHIRKYDFKCFFGIIDSTQNEI